MKTYGQFCPAAKAAELFCERWTALIVREMWVGSTRFSEIHRGVPLMSPTLLSKRLKELEAEGIVERRREEGERGYRYHLTAAGIEFVPLVDALGRWGQRWSRRELAESEVDLGLLLWWIEQHAQAEAFGTGRSVVRLEFTDQTQGKRLWWFINEHGDCQMCVHDPGFEVDLYVTCTLPDMIHLVRGDITVERAIDADRLEVIGPKKLARHLGRWLEISPWSKIEPARREPAVRAE